MVHYLFLLAHWLSLWYTSISYLPIGCLNGTLLSSTCLLALPIVHNYILLAHWPPHASVEHYYLLLANWLSLWYITIFFLPTGYLYDTLPPSIGPLAISMVYYLYFWPIGCLCGALLSSIGQLANSMLFYHLLLANWLSLWYTTIFFWPSGPFYVTLPFSTGPFVVSMVNYIFYWPTDCLYGTLPSSTGPLDISMEHNHHLLTH